MNEQLRSRLYNWKFNEALNHLEGTNDWDREIIEALAATFGDCGWFEGNMGAIVEGVVHALASGIFPRDEKNG